MLTLHLSARGAPIAPALEPYLAKSLDMRTMIEERPSEMDKRDSSVSFGMSVMGGALVSFQTP